MLFLLKHLGQLVVRQVQDLFLESKDNWEKLKCNLKQVIGKCVDRQCIVQECMKILKKIKSELSSRIEASETT